MTHPNSEQLSDYLDGELPAGETRLLETHLVQCGECAALLAEIRRVVARAQSLEDRPPRADLWPGVAAAIGAVPGRGRRLTLSIPQLLAAGIALMVLSGTAVALMLRVGPAPTARGPEAASPSVHQAAASAERGYDAAIRKLEGQVFAGQGRLDSATVRVVEEKLRLIDLAIVEAERALATDPANAYLNSHLTQTRMRKLDLLRRAAALSRAVS